jgi:hypothetical protein
MSIFDEVAGHREGNFEPRERPGISDHSAEQFALGEAGSDQERVRAFDDPSKGRQGQQAKGWPGNSKLHDLTVPRE